MKYRITIDLAASPQAMQATVDTVNKRLADHGYDYHTRWETVAEGTPVPAPERGMIAHAALVERVVLLEQVLPVLKQADDDQKTSLNAAHNQMHANLQRTVALEATVASNTKTLATLYAMLRRVREAIVVGDGG